ncbi:MAG: peptidoglycan-binding protein, partial [Candidatus Paceibacterota bacterium]
MKKYLLGLLMIAFVIVPFVGQAISVQELMAQIAALQAQLATMQNQQPIESSSSPVVVSCPTITRTLAVGSKGDEVSALQRYLMEGGFITIIQKPTGYYGVITKVAVIAWQKANDVKPANGIFGPSSRNKLAELCGGVIPSCPPIVTLYWPGTTQYRSCLNNGGSWVTSDRDANGCIVSPHCVGGSSAISINSVSGPNSLDVGQTGTWAVKATGPAGTNLNYSVDWGDVVVYAHSATAGTQPVASQSATFTHSYSRAGTYTVRFMVDNGVMCIQAPCNARQSAETTLTVVVGASAQPSITVLSPNGGENWQIGNTYRFVWKSSGVKLININLDNIDNGYRYGTFNVPNGLAAIAGEAYWTVRNTNLPPGRYKVYITSIDKEAQVWPSDSSDNYFIITSGIQSTSTCSNVVDCSNLYHPADLNRNYIIEKSELDAFTVLYQAGDPNATLSKLLRVIQFYNSAGYRVDRNNTEDGFAPIPKTGAISQSSASLLASVLPSIPPLDNGGDVPLSTPVINPIARPVSANGIVTITGKGLNSLRNTVYIGAALRVSIASPTRNSIKIQLRKRVPAGTYPVYVVNSAGKSNT